MQSTVKLATAIVLTAAAFAESFGNVSFSPPPGWKYEQKAGGNFASMTVVSGQGYCVLGVYDAAPAAQDPQVGFRESWRQIITQRFQAAAPASAASRTLAGGLVVWEASAAASLNGSNGVVGLSLVTEGSFLVPVVTLAPNRATLDTYRSTIDQVMNSIRVTGPAAASAAVTPPAQPGQIRIADLDGEWREGDSSFVTYVDSTSGAYRGSSSMAYGKTTILKAEGTYSYVFNGLRDGRPYKQEGGGTFGFSGNLLVFVDKIQNQTKRFQIVGFERQSDGSTLLKLLPPEYDARPGNVMLYAEKWIRGPQRSGRDK